MINKTQEEIMKNWVGDINNPLVSIKCTAYNHEKYISDALDGFLMQETTFPFEVIVHDDASTDNTANIIREYEKKFPLIIKPIYEKENQYSKHDGPLSRIMNSKIKGKYIAFCEGDDYWINSSKLNKQVFFLDNNKEYIAVGHITKSVDRNGNEINTFIDSKPGEYTIEDNSNWQLFSHVSSWMIRTSYISAFNNLYPDYYQLNVPGDRKVPLLLLSVGKLYVLSDCYSIYRFQSTKYSFTSKKSNNNLVKIYKEYEDLEQYAVSHNIKINYDEPKKRVLLISFFELLKLKNIKNFFIIINIRNSVISDIVFCIKGVLKVLLSKCNA